MKFVQLGDLEKSKLLNLKSPVYLVFRCGPSILVGPRLSDKFCSECFLKRLGSSDFVEEYNYENVPQEILARVKKNLKQHRPRQNEFFEFKTNTLKSTHFFLNIPGCNHSPQYDQTKTYH